MTLISIRDFRSNQGKYLGLAASGESVVSKSEFLAKIDAARASITNGEGISVKGKNELSSFLESL